METKHDYTKARETKLATGEVVKLTEEEMQNVVDLFKLLSNWDRELMLEAVNGAKVELIPLTLEKAKLYVGRKIWIAIQVKEEIQMQQWDHYYKLESVTLEGSNSKTKTLKVIGFKNKSIEIEHRGAFIEKGPRP